MAARYRQAAVQVRVLIACAALGLVLAAASLVSLAMGAVPIPVGRVAGIVLEPLGISTSASQTEQLVVRQIRLPRILTGILVGMALGAAGATMQGLFRNPMADPGIIGVSAGGAAGAVLAIALGAGARFPLALPLSAFLGAVTAALVVFGIAGAGGRGATATILLAGVAVNSFLGAVISAIIALVPRSDTLRGILFWLAGGLDGRSWDHVLIAAPAIATGLAVIFVMGRDINLLLLGDNEARSLGVRPGLARPALLLAACLVTGVAVAVSGIVAFVGLVAPHMLRIVLGPDHRVLLPASALSGALFVVVADTLARTLVSPAELQVGILTSLVGAPFFLFLLVRNRRQAEALG